MNTLLFSLKLCFFVLELRLGVNVNMVNKVGLTYPICFVLLKPLYNLVRSICGKYGRVP